MNKEDLQKMRHSAEHVLTMAVLKLFPKVKMAMGPATEDGFYFDFDLNGEVISENDFAKIEEEMARIIKADLGFKKEEVEIGEAQEMFAGNEYKEEWISEIENRDEKATIYRTGKEFVDLCAGPHVTSTGKIRAIKLLSIAGAYWRGSEKNKMLTRIYGTAFESKKELDEFLARLVEAKKRDHKKIGKELDLFSFSPLVGPGLPLWSPRGTILRNLLDDFVWELRRARGYEKVEIPHIAKKELYETSGHWEKFKDDLFRLESREGAETALKPMNCPHHAEIFGRKPMSYREMPQRYCNTTMVYRDEQSGELSGLSRVESITQDDAHVFCRMSQVKDEFLKIWDIIDEFYGVFGFELTVNLSLHDPKTPEKYLGGKDDWEKAEGLLRELAKERGVKVREDVGQAAFYGPKMDFIAKDSLGREWQVATIQLDMNMPERFDLACVNEKGERERVVMIHAAIMGSIERFLSVIIEHFAGNFPTWLSPVQVKVLAITDKQALEAGRVYQKLKEEGIRVELDDRSETLGAKIRDAQMMKVPYMIILGQREVEAKKIAVRTREEKDLGQMELVEFIEKIKENNRDRKTKL